MTATNTATDNAPSPVDEEKILTLYNENKDEIESLYKDINQACIALDLFINSRMEQAESMLDPARVSSMYQSLGYAFCKFFKSIMTFETQDINEAIESLSNTMVLACQLKQSRQGWLGSLTSMFKSNITTLQALTPVQLHAMLVNAEAQLLKSLLGVVRQQSIWAVVQSGLPVRDSYMTFKRLEELVTLAELHDLPLDPHFTSGVKFGLGVFNLMLSLLPRNILRLIEFMGFEGDRNRGLELLQSIGHWDTLDDIQVQPPTTSPSSLTEQPLRRPFADLVLLFYGFILSPMVALELPHVHSLAKRVLTYNLSAYPDGVLFLYFQGRQLSIQRDIDAASASYLQAVEKQKDWVQIKHLCFWECGFLSIMNQHWNNSLELYDTLLAESKWSPAIYHFMYGLAQYQLSLKDGEPFDGPHLRQAMASMTMIKDWRRQIAGKSIPIEKFVVRKARSFVHGPGQRPLLDLEALCAFNVVEFMPRPLMEANKSRVEKALVELQAEKEPRRAYWYDDVCLAQYLQAVLARMLADDTATTTNERDSFLSTQHSAIKAALGNAQHIVHDHYLYYVTLYEHARYLFKIENNSKKALDQIMIIINTANNGKYIGGKGRQYTLENSLLFKCHSYAREIQSHQNR